MVRLTHIRLHIHSQLYYFPFSLSHQHSGKLAMLIFLPELILHSQSVTARGHSPHKQQMSLNYWYYLNFCKMHAFQFSRPFRRALVREVCLHVKGLSALLPEHKIGTGMMLDFCCFFFSVVRQPEFSILYFLPHVISASSAAYLLPVFVFFSGHLSIARQSRDVFLFLNRQSNRDIVSVGKQTSNHLITL